MGLYILDFYMICHIFISCRRRQFERSNGWKKKFQTLEKRTHPAVPAPLRRRGFPVFCAHGFRLL